MSGAKLAGILWLPLIVSCAASPGGSCTLSNNSQCTDYIGVQWNAASVQAVCQSGTYLSGACSTTNRVASCSINPGSASEYVYRYYSSAFDLASAQSNCNAFSGTFTPN